MCGSRTSVDAWVFYLQLVKACSPFLQPDLGSLGGFGRQLQLFVRSLKRPILFLLMSKIPIRDSQRTFNFLHAFIHFQGSGTTITRLGVRKCL